MNATNPEILTFHVVYKMGAGQLGSDRGGRAAAILSTLIQSAKRHDLDPFVYLRDLLLRIPTHPNKDIHLLLPDQWKTHLLPEATAPFKL